MEALAIYAPIVEVRDVLESFIADRMLIPGRQQTLASAGNEFADLADQGAGSDMRALSQRIAALARHGLEAQPALTRSVATELAHFVDRTRIPGVPRPEDEDWSF